MRKIAVIGPGPRALAIWRLLAGGGYHVVLSDGRQAPLPYDAATGSEVVVFAAPFSQVEALVAQVGRILPETIVVDATEGAPLPGGTSSASELAHRLDTHRVVRASIPLPQPNANVFLAADDATAMTEVEAIFRTCGCVTHDAGTLANASDIELHRTA